MNRILGNRNFALLWTAQFIEQIGDSLTLMTLIAWAMSMPAQSGSSSMNMSVLMFFIGLPIIFLGPFAGVFIDRMKRKIILILSAVFKGTAIFFMFLFIGDKGLVPLIFFTAFLMSVASQFFIPAKSSFIPKLVAKQELLIANSVSAVTTVIVQIVGFAIAGIIIASMGFQKTVMLAVIAYVLVLTALSFISVNESVKKSVKGTGRVWKEFKEGIKYLFSNKKITFMVRRVFVVMIGVGLFYVSLAGKYLGVILSATGLRMEEIKALGFMQACLGIGLVMGTVFIEAIAKKTKEETLVRITFPLLGAGIAVLYFFPNYYYLLGMSVAAGFAGVIILGLAETVIQKNAPDRMRGRMFAAYYFIRNAGTVIASTATGFIVIFVKEPEVILSVGAGLIIYGAVNFFNRKAKQRTKSK